MNITLIFILVFEPKNLYQLPSSLIRFSVVRISNTYWSTYNRIDSLVHTSHVALFKGAKIQLLDLPGIIEGAKDGKGRGKQVIAVARTCHLIFIW